MQPVHYSIAKTASASLKWFTWPFPLQSPWHIGGFDLSAHNTLIVASVIAARFIHTFLFGPLRISEVSRLTNQLTYTICEMVIAIVLAREQVTLTIGVVCVLFLILKWFHMVLQDRMNRLEWKDGAVGAKTPSAFVAANSRILLALVFLNLCDVFCLALYLRKLSQRTMVSTIIAVELSVQYTNIWYLSGHYVLTALDRKPRPTGTQGDQWVARRKLVTHMLTTSSDLAKLWLYMGLSMYMVGKYCVPVHLFRESYLTLRLAIQKVRALIWLRKVSGQYDSSAFEQPESVDEDEICLVCREVIQGKAINSCVQLQCSHIFHYDCLLDWLACNNCCPICRKEVRTTQN